MPGTTCAGKKIVPQRSDLSQRIDDYGAELKRDGRWEGHPISQVEVDFFRWLIFLESVL